MNIGENIKNRREELKLSQEYVADQLGVTKQTVSKWETGQSEPTASNLIQLAEIFEISLSELANPQNRPNLILRANLIRVAITSQAASMFCCTQAIFQLRHPDYPDKDLSQGFLIFSFVLMMLSSIWMAVNHRYETDINQRRKNANIELGYCCVQTLVGLLTIHYSLGLVGLALILVVLLVYILYINPKFMARKLAK